MRTAIISSLVLAATVSAQTTHVVTVSAFQFSPNNITAAAGDKVTFVFSGSPGAHSVTQSTFAAPCTPLEGGFNSGFVTVAANATPPFEEYSLTVASATQPIWFYCAQSVPGPHCTFGMVGSINAATTGNTIESFVSKAKAFPTASFSAVASGVDSPTGGVNISAVAAVATGSDAAASSTAPPNSAPPTGLPAPSGSGASGTANGTASPSGTTKPSSANVLNGFTTVGAAIFAVLFGVTL